MSEPNLITSTVLQGREYLVKMNVTNKYLEMIISDKQTGEEWQCSYDQAYIENLTHKTGNFKQYDVFVTMIKSGLLKTSDSITLELLTFEDLDTLRTKKIRNYTRHFNNAHGNNRRYLIITYSVEFDRIHYPLPLEYCGPPDPAVLQATIRKLEAELSLVREELVSKGLKSDTSQILMLQRRLDDLSLENEELKDEVLKLRSIGENDRSKNQVKLMQKAIVSLERSVLNERKSHHRLVEKLRSDKVKLLDELERCKNNEKALRFQLEQIRLKSSNVKREKSNTDSLQTIFRRPTNLLKSKSEDTRRNHETKFISPRNVKSEGCEPKSRSRKEKRRKPLKPQSRSSSMSSSRNLETFFALAESGGCCQSRSSSTSSKKRNLKATRSRSSSVNSNSSENSSSNRSYKPTSLKGIRSRLRRSDRDFLALENRILKLQDILKDGAKTGNI